MRALLAALCAAVALGCATPGGEPETRARPAQCTTNSECGNEECIRPRGEVRGICGRLGDQYGHPTTSIGRTAASCQNDFDCPVRFRCELTTPNVGLCVEAL